MRVSARPPPRLPRNLALWIQRYRAEVEKFTIPCMSLRTCVTSQPPRESPCLLQRTKTSKRLEESLSRRPSCSEAAKQRFHDHVMIIEQREIAVAADGFIGERGHSK